MPNQRGVAVDRKTSTKPDSGGPILDLRRWCGVEGTRRLKRFRIELSSGSTANASSIARTSKAERSADVGVLAPK